MKWYQVGTVIFHGSADIEGGCMIEGGWGTWISSSCRVMKGTKLPPNSVVVGGSLVNKDFSGDEPCQVYAGTSAKTIKRNTRRIFNKKAEREVDSYFARHPRKKTCQLQVDEDMDAYCWTNYFRWEEVKR